MGGCKCQLSIKIWGICQLSAKFGQIVTKLSLKGLLIIKSKDF